MGRAPRKPFLNLRERFDVTEPAMRLLSDQESSAGAAVLISHGSVVSDLMLTL